MPDQPGLHVETGRTPPRNEKPTFNDSDLWRRPPKSYTEASNSDTEIPSSSTSRDHEKNEKLEEVEKPELPPSNGESFERITRTKTGKTEVSEDDYDIKRWWRFKLRPADDDLPQDWWFASTAIPLLAATLGPLSNVTSIVSLVSPWRNNYAPGALGDDLTSIGYPDPDWCIHLNIASLVLGFVGNIALMFNFTRKVRYIVALPATIFMWYGASFLLVAAQISMNLEVPPVAPEQVYSQSFWHGVISAVLYFLSSSILLINMLGYLLGHYPQHFELTDEQRNLILQTLMFFIWLAGGAGIFSVTNNLSYANAVYFCDVTILTVGFGDIVPMNNLSRGLVFPYTVGGIIMLGLMVSSIRRFAIDLGHSKIVRKHAESRRAKTLERVVTTSFEARERTATLERQFTQKPQISPPLNPETRTIAFNFAGEEHHRRERDIEAPRSAPLPNSKSLLSPSAFSFRSSLSRTSTLSRISHSIPNPMKRLARRRPQVPKILVLKAEKDRFDKMRDIQKETTKFKKYFALVWSVLAFGVLWCIGAVVFWQTEQNTQGLSYFEALYFCYVSLLTIGYGDLAPTSNAGRPFFVVWSLFAVPTITILVSDMGDTVIHAYKQGTFTLAKWTVLPEENLIHNFLKSSPRLAPLLRAYENRRARERVEAGFQIGPEGPQSEQDRSLTIEQLAEDSELDEHTLARRLAVAIRHVADDLSHFHEKRYTYEEWVEFTRLIRFSRYDHHTAHELGIVEETEGLVDWDWIGEDSPLMADQYEPEWLLDRLVESLDRYMRKQLPAHVKKHRKTQAAVRREEEASGNNARRNSSVAISTGVSVPGAGEGRRSSRAEREREAEVADLHDTSKPLAFNRRGSVDQEKKKHVPRFSTLKGYRMPHGRSRDPKRGPRM